MKSTMGEVFCTCGMCEQCMTNKETIEQEALSFATEYIKKLPEGWTTQLDMIFIAKNAYIKGRTDQASDWKRVGELANEIQKIVRNDSNN